MKKKFIFPFIFISGLLTLNINIIVRGEKKDESYLTLKNIEALANNGEITDSFCFYNGSVDCPNYDIKAKHVW